MKRNWLTVREVADHLGVAVTTVYGLCESRQIAHIRVGTGRGSIRIAQQALDDYIAASVVATDVASRKKVHSNKE